MSISDNANSSNDINCATSVSINHLPSINGKLTPTLISPNAPQLSRRELGVPATNSPKVLQSATFDINSKLKALNLHDMRDEITKDDSATYILPKLVDSDKLKKTRSSTDIDPLILNNSGLDSLVRPRRSSKSATSTNLSFENNGQGQNSTDINAPIEFDLVQQGRSPILEKVADFTEEFLNLDEFDESIGANVSRSSKNSSLNLSVKSSVIKIENFDSSDHKKTSQTMQRSLSRLLLQPLETPVATSDVVNSLLYDSLIDVQTVVLNSKLDTENLNKISFEFDF